MTDPASPTPRTVLIAEDEVLIRMDLAEMLVEEGYDVVGQADDGQAAIDLAQQLRPDLVIMNDRPVDETGGQLVGFLSALAIRDVSETASP